MGTVETRWINVVKLDIRGCLMGVLKLMRNRHGKRINRGAGKKILLV